MMCDGSADSGSTKEYASTYVVASKKNNAPPSAGTSLARHFSLVRSTPSLSQIRYRQDARRLCRLPCRSRLNCLGLHYHRQSFHRLPLRCHIYHSQHGRKAFPRRAQEDGGLQVSRRLRQVRHGRRIGHGKYCLLRRRARRRAPQVR